MRAELTAVIRKELRQTFRDKRMAAMLILAPVLQLVLLGYTVDLEVDRIPTAIVDQDWSPATRALTRGLLADGTLTRCCDGADPVELMASGAAYTVVVLPRGLGEALARGDAAQVQVLVNGTDPIRAQVATNTATEYFHREGMRLAKERLAQAAALKRRPPAMGFIQVEPRIYYNPALESPLYMVPGVAALTLLVVTTIVTAMGIAREREIGTIEQLMITPMRPTILLLGKTLPFALIGLVVAGLVLAVGTHLFAVPVRGSLAVIFVGTVLYLMSTLGVGVFISTVSRTQQQAILGGFFFLMPAILLSGFMSPVENMPQWIRPLTWVNPVYYYVDLLRSCLLKGAGFLDMWDRLVALLLFGVGILALAASRFQKQLA